MTDLTDFNVPWKNVAEVTVSELDVGYYWHSAQKLISPMVFDISGAIDHIQDSDLSELTTQQRTLIAGTIFNIFNRKWQRLWNAYTMSYNPIHNYTMQESEVKDGEISRNGANTGTVTKSDTGTVSDQRTEGGTRQIVTDTDTTNTGTQSNSGTSNTENGIFGFNSSSSVGSDTSDNTNSNLRTDNLACTEDTTELETRNLTDNNTRTLNTTDTETRNLSNVETVSTDETVTSQREGTTGIYTPQQLLTEEFELWQWNFFKQVFEDIDSILCLCVY